MNLERLHDSRKSIRKCIIEGKWCKNSEMGDISNHGKKILYLIACIPSSKAVRVGHPVIISVTTNKKYQEKVSHGKRNSKMV